MKQDHYQAKALELMRAICGANQIIRELKAKNLSPAFWEKAREDWLQELEAMGPRPQ